MTLTSSWTTVPSQYDVFAFGEQNLTTKDFRCTSISRSHDSLCDIEALEYSADVYNDEETVDDIIRIIRPDFHAKGTDYAVETVPEIETARSVGCETVIVGDPKDHSSSEIIGRIRPED